MKIRPLLIVLIFFMSNTLIGQSLNEYKYVIVPAKYDFLKSENQYELNALTKFLFEKEGFKTIYDNLELPADIANNPCTALTAKVNNGSNMFTTKLVIELINCKNQKVLITKEGKSKEKNYKSGYQGALREAFEDVTAQNYAYSGKGKPVAVTETPPVIEVVEDVHEVEEVKQAEEVQEIKEMEVEETVFENNPLFEAKKDNRDRDDNGNILSVPSEKKLYAQENSQGYQLVNSEPEIIFQLLKSGKKDVYYLKNRTGNFFKENDKWYAEYYFGGHLIKQEFEVKW